MTTCHEIRANNDPRLLGSSTSSTPPKRGIEPGLDARNYRREYHEVVLLSHDSGDISNARAPALTFPDG